MSARGAGKRSQSRVVESVWVISTASRGERLKMSHIATAIIGTYGEIISLTPSKSRRTSCEMAALELPMANPIAKSSGIGRRSSSLRSCAQM